MIGRSVQSTYRLYGVSAFALLLLIVGGCNSAPSGQLAAQSSPVSVDSSKQPYLFDGAAAYKELVAQCNFGIRSPVAPGHEKCKQYILSAFKPYCDEVTTQNFTFQDNARKVNLHLTNIFGIINPSAKPRIMISAHWDTRPTADNDFDLANRDKPIMGADDGASGVAVLIELARALHQERPKCGIVLACWDGEDWGPGEDKMYLGARYFVQHPDPIRPDESILLDMIGQKDLVIDREQYSQAKFPHAMDLVWQAANEANETSVFQNAPGEGVDDDQVSLADLNAPSIDLIDFNYAYWHTLQDTPDKCDAKSLDAVGKTLEQLIRDTDAAGVNWRAS